MRTVVLLGLALLLSPLLPRPARADDAAKYKLEDLRALGESQGWAELLEHAEDVRPSERKGEWRTLLEKAAVGQLVLLESQKKLPELLATADHILSRFPTMKTSKPFMAKRRDAGLPAFRECMRDAYGTVQCVEQIDAFVRVDPTDGEAQLAAARLVAHGGMWAAAAPFFARAFDDPKLRKEGCRDDALPETIRRAFGQPPEYDHAKAASKVAFEQCFEPLRPVLMQAFFDSGGYDAKNLCAGFKKTKTKLTAFQAAYCQDQEG